MDKRKEANLRVRTSITDALFTLMRKKELKEITVTEIIRESGVARASFYRNYSSKEDVLVGLIRDVLEQYRSMDVFDAAHPFSYNNLLSGLRLFNAYRVRALALYNAGFGQLILDEFNTFHESLIGPLPADSLLRYLNYVYIGILYNVGISWMREESPRPLEEVVQEIVSRFHQD